MLRLRMGILGAWRDRRTLRLGIPRLASIDIVAIGSRDQVKADAFAAKHNIAKAYGSYAAIVEDKEIDAVYVALPNGLHKEWAIKCAKAGKHILCEKPMALTRADAKRCSMRRTRTRSCSSRISLQIPTPDPGSAPPRG